MISHVLLCTNYVFNCFQGLPDLGEIYPLGGAGDRLNLVDSDTGEFLPAAMLPYCGRTLLEGLIRDLQVKLSRLTLEPLMLDNAMPRSYIVSHTTFSFS